MDRIILKVDRNPVAYSDCIIDILNKKVYTVYDIDSDKLKLVYDKYGIEKYEYKTNNIFEIKAYGFRNIKNKIYIDNDNDIFENKVINNAIFIENKYKNRWYIGNTMIYIRYMLINTKFGYIETNIEVYHIDKNGNIHIDDNEDNKIIKEIKTNKVDIKIMFDDKSIKQYNKVIDFINSVIEYLYVNIEGIDVSYKIDDDIIDNKYITEPMGSPDKILIRHNNKGIYTYEILNKYELYNEIKEEYENNRLDKVINSDMITNIKNKIKEYIKDIDKIIEPIINIANSDIDKEYIIEKVLDSLYNTYVIIDKNNIWFIDKIDDRVGISRIKIFNIDILNIHKYIVDRIIIMSIYKCINEIINVINSDIDEDDKDSGIYIPDFIDAIIYKIPGLSDIYKLHNAYEHSYEPYKGTIYTNKKIWKEISKIISDRNIDKNGVDIEFIPEED